MIVSLNLGKEKAGQFLLISKILLMLRTHRRLLGSIDKRTKAVSYVVIRKASISKKVFSLLGIATVYL